MILDAGLNYNTRDLGCYAKWPPIHYKSFGHGGNLMFLWYWIHYSEFAKVPTGSKV